jgi:putative oxidoreductase
MLWKLFQTNTDRTLTFLRVVAGGVMFVHGAQKVLGWFSGPGFGASMTMFGQLGIPPFWAFLAIVTEFFGSLVLIAGLFGRFAAFGLTVEMLVAVLLVHLKFGFFMNWMGTQRGEGFEYHILLAGLTLPILVEGAGAWSLDRWIARWLKGRRGLNPSAIGYLQDVRAAR